MNATAATARRLAQGISALFAFARSPDLSLARRYLAVCEFKAFCSMSRSEQLHSLNVLQNVLAGNPKAPKALIKAALLHDVGKSRYRLSLWQKTLAVIIEAIAPGANRQLSEDQTMSFWRAPFIVRRHHARWSGETLRSCGASADVIWLVERHQDNAERHRDNPRYSLLASLQRADGEC